MNNKGFVLILVLILMASCVSAVMGITLWVSKNCDWSQKLYLSNKSSIYIRSALNAALRFLEEDDNYYDSPDETWANIPPFPIENGGIILQITPANAKIDINLFFSHNKNLRERIKRAVSEILLQHGVDEEVMDYMMAWVKKDIPYDEGYYLLHMPHYIPRKKLFYSLREIDFVQQMQGFSKKFYPYFTVNGSKKININFASKEVLLAYLPELGTYVDDIIFQRKQRPFENISQLRDIVGISDDIYLAVQPYITVKSHLFIIRVIVSIDKHTYYATALVKRSGRKAYILKYFEGNAFYE